MKKLFLLLLISAFGFAQNPTKNVAGFYAGSTTMNASAIGQFDSTTKGFLVPRMTTTQRNAISSPATSLLIFNTTTGAYNYYNGSAWTDFGGSQDLESVLTVGNVVNFANEAEFFRLNNTDNLNSHLIVRNTDAGTSEIYNEDENYYSILGNNALSIRNKSTSEDAVYYYDRIKYSSGGIGANNLKYPIPLTGIDAYVPTSFSVNGGASVSSDSNGKVSLTVPTGTVTTVSVVTANGVTGSVANATTTPAITFSLGAITPTTVVASGNITAPNIDATNKTDIATNTSNIALKANTASPTFTGTVTVPNGAVLGTPASINLANATFPTLNQNTTGTASNLSGTPALPNGTTATTQSVNDNSTKLATTAYADAAALSRKDLVLPGKTIVVFGDSYSTGIGATNTGRGYINILKDGIGCQISNNAVQGTTIQKRVPINYIGSPNMVDNATNIPTYSEATHGLLLFEFGLNDLGQTAAAYTTANFITDYQTVLTTAISTKGWPANKILITGAPYANSTGYAAYATITGNAAPDVTRHLAFIEAARQVAQTNQTMFLDLYAAQVKNGVSTTMNADGYHPNDAGHFAIAKIIANYLGYTGVFESRVPASSSTPSVILSGGAATSVTAGASANMVAILYNDGVNKAGFGESSNNQEYHIYSGGKHTFYANDVALMSVNATGMALRQGTTVPTAKLMIGAGTTAASSAPLKFVAGTNMTTPEAGAVEFDGTNYFATSSTTRYTLAKTLTATATLDFGSTAAGAATDLTLTVTGAADGDVVSIGVPNGSTVANGSFTAWVSASNTVTIRFSNSNLVTALDPASGTFRASVIKY